MTLQELGELRNDKEPLIRILARIGRYRNARLLRRDLDLYEFRKDMEMYNRTLEIARIAIRNTLLILSSEEVQKEIKK